MESTPPPPGHRKPKKPGLNRVKHAFAILMTYMETFTTKKIRQYNAAIETLKVLSANSGVHIVVTIPEHAHNCGLKRIS